MAAKGVTSMEDVKAPILREFMQYLEEKGHNPGGIATFYRSILALCRFWELETDGDFVSPMKKVRRPKVIIQPLPGITVKEIQRMVENAGTGRMELRDKAALLTLLDTGARRSEFINLKIGDLNLETGAIKIWGGKGGIFFTPEGLARDFAVMVSPKGRVLDLCAGIGRLSHAVLMEDRFSKEITEIVAVEYNPEFVGVGKKILPQMTWLEGSVFDFDLMGALGTFDCVISNPPYGNIPVGVSGPMRIKTAAHIMAIEIALRASYNGCSMIIPYTDIEYDYNTGRQQTSNNLKRLKKAFPGISITPEPIDTTIYEDEWEGAAPKVAIADIDVFECEETFPLGFEFNRSFATPSVGCTLC